MTHYTTVVNGLQNYFLSEILSQRKGSAASLFGGVAVRYAGARAEKLFQIFSKNEMLKVIGVVDGEMVDVDGLYAALLEQIRSDGSLTINLPAIGAITFHQSDIEAAFRYIKS